MRKINILLFLLALCCVSSTARTASAQIAGGYGAVDKNDPEVKAAAKYAVAAETRHAHHTIKLISINKAEQQVVAGMNYKVCMKVRDGKKTRWATAVVYQNLKNKRSLTSWDWGACNW